MNNQIRRELLNRHRQSGFPGSIMDVFSAYNAGRDIISEFIQEQQRQQQLQQMQQMQQQQSQPIVANTPEEQEQGLRPYHEAGQTDQSMVFPNIPANTPFNTVGMKAPINIDKYDNQGHLIESFKSVPPGIQNLPTGPQEGTVVETPANMQTGGVRKYQYAGPVTEAPRVPALSDAEMSLKIIQEANAGNPAARRMRSDYGQRMFLPGETSPSTHYMASFDNYAVPTVQEEYIGGPLKYNPNPNPGKEDFRFDTPEQAAYFSNNYKNASASKALYRQPEDMQTGGVRRYQTGSSPDPDLAPGITQLPEAVIQTDRVPYSKISDNSRMMGVGWAKPFFEAAGNNPDSKLYKIGQKILDERKQDLDRSEMIMEFTSIPGFIRTAERLEGKDPLKTIAKEGKIDLLSTLPLAGGIYKGLRLAEKGSKQAVKAAKYATTQTPLRHTYKLNPKALKLDDVEILQRWHADKNPSGLPVGVMPDKYTGKWYGSNYDLNKNIVRDRVPGVSTYMGIRPGPGEIRTAVVPRGSANLPEELLTGPLSKNVIFSNQERILPEGFTYNVTRVNNNPVDLNSIDLDITRKTLLKGNELAENALPKPHWLKGYSLTKANQMSKQLPGSREYQGGGSKNVDPFSSFEVAKHMARIHGGTPQHYLALSDTSGYHESGHTMDPEMVQRGSGIAKGAFQIEASSIPRLQQRVRQYAQQTGNKVPSWINIPNNDARNLSLDRQRALFLLDMNYSEGTNMRAYAQGKTTSAEQWLQGWKRKEAADGKDIERFETSANKARQMGIPNSSVEQYNQMLRDKAKAAHPLPPTELIRMLTPSRNK